MRGNADRLPVTDHLRIAVAGAGYTAIGDYLRQVLPEAVVELVAPHLLLENERDATVLIPVMSRISGAATRRPDPQTATHLSLAWLGGLAELPVLLARSDYLFLCLPLNEQTHGIIDALALLPDQACVINAGRGGLLDHGALLDALAAGHLAGAGLDVFDQEPLDPGAPLLTRPDIVATPHIAGVTDAAYQGVAIRVADNIRRLLAGETLHDCVNPPDIGS